MGDLVKNFKRRRDARLKKRMDDDWITMHGTHVLIDDEGQVSKGPSKLKGVVKNGGGYKSKGNGWKYVKSPKKNGGEYVKSPKKKETKGYKIPTGYGENDFTDREEQEEWRPRLPDDVLESLTGKRRAPKPFSIQKEVEPGVVEVKDEYKRGSEPSYNPEKKSWEAKLPKSAETSDRGSKSESRKPRGYKQKQKEKADKRWEKEMTDKGYYRTEKGVWVKGPKPEPKKTPNPETKKPGGYKQKQGDKVDKEIEERLGRQGYKKTGRGYWMQPNYVPPKKTENKSRSYDEADDGKTGSEMARERMIERTKKKKAV